MLDGEFASAPNMSEYLKKQFSNYLTRDLFNFVVGETLGTGAHRETCVFEPDPKLVIKMEYGARSFQNIMEWETWQNFASHAKVGPWLAPCHSISPCGMFLIQERTHRPSEYPEQIPAWLCDFKRTNFGALADGRFVSHDYGNNLLQRFGPTSRTVKANWWELQT